MTIEHTGATPESYLDSLYEIDETLERVKQSIRELDMPDISVAPAYGKLLTLLIRMSGARSALEIGALAGYSGVCIARGLPKDGKLVSLELRPDFAELAQRNLQEAGFGELVEYRVGEALTYLEQMRSSQEKFDFFFIDADKANYGHYLNYAVELSKPGAIIVADNLLMRGKTLDPSVTKASVQAIRAFNRQVAAHPKLESVMLPAFDGLAIARVRG